MVSALRLRATRLSGDPADRADTGAPSGRPSAAPPPMRRHRLGPPLRALLRGWRAPRGLSFRRFGLLVSIVGAMAASAIGGGLVAARAPSPAATPNGPAAAAPSVRPGDADHPATPPADPPARTPAVAAAPAADPAQHATAAAASADVASADPHAPPASAAAMAVEPARAAHPPPAPAAAAPPSADLTFGLDVNGDGIPDSLERFVRKAIDAPATRVAARRYYRVALPLATLADQGEPLTVADQNAVFRAAECYWLSAAADGLSNAPNLNDRASLVGAAAARRMQALAEALRGVDYRVGGIRRQSCG